MNQKHLKSILDYNPETGVFKWKEKCGGAFSEKDAGWNDNGYIRIMIKSKAYLAHRLAWLYVYGTWPEKFLDHINNNPSDNRIVNLREVTNAQNSFNQKRSVGNTSGYKGVSFHKHRQKFQANIKKNYIQYYLGLFDTAKEAHEAYCRKAKELYREFANFGQVKKGKENENN